MIRKIGIIATFLSALFFPWPLTAVLALGVSLSEPLVPLAAGLFADALYYTSSASALPFFTISGAIATGIAFFVRSRLKTGIIEG
jgi:hypothetical protein